MMFSNLVVQDLVRLEADRVVSQPPSASLRMNSTINDTNLIHAIAATNHTTSTTLLSHDTY